MLPFKFEAIFEANLVDSYIHQGGAVWLSTAPPPEVCGHPTHSKVPGHSQGYISSVSAKYNMATSTEHIENTDKVGKSSKVSHVSARNLDVRGLLWTWPQVPLVSVCDGLNECPGQHSQSWQRGCVKWCYTSTQWQIHVRHCVQANFINLYSITYFINKVVKRKQRIINKKTCCGKILNCLQPNGI